MLSIKYGQVIRLAFGHSFWGNQIRSLFYGRKIIEYRIHSKNKNPFWGMIYLFWVLNQNRGGAYFSYR